MSLELSYVIRYTLEKIHAPELLCTELIIQNLIFIENILYYTMTVL